MQQQDRLPPRNFATSLRASLKATFSPATTQLLQESVKPDPNFGVIASILKADPALATAILSLVNSPYYGQTSKISDLQRAAIILGNNEILRIALSLSLHKNLNVTLEKSGFDTFANWRVIIWSALGAELIARRLSPREAETAYICALVKDLSLLLYAASYPEHMRQQLAQPDFVNTGPSFMCSQDYLPADHCELTAELLTEWNFPPHMIAAITAHHDLEHVFDHPPLTQAVILGTRWAEVEFRTDPAPDGLTQLHFLLTRAQALPPEGLEGLRQRCTALFAEMAAAMNITEPPPESRLYAHSLQAIQDFHFQAKELESLTGGNAAIAACISRHLRWNWNCRKGEIILGAPTNNHWECFTFDEGGMRGPAVSASLREFRTHGEFTVRLETEDGVAGELRLSDIPESDTARAEVTLYGRLLARSLWRQITTVAQLEIKAELLDILPTGVALLDEEGRILRANPTFARFLGNAAQLEDRLRMDMDAEQFERTQHGWNMFLLDPSQAAHCAIYSPLGPKSVASTPFALSGYKIRQGSKPNILAVVQDLSEIRILEFEALHQRDFLNNLLSSMQDLVMTTDRNGGITFASGRHGAFLTGRNLFELTRPMNALEEPWDMEFLEQSPAAVEVQIVLDDEHLQLELVFSRFAFGADYGLIVGRNISAIRRLERKIREQALFDSLTQVFNRHHLQPLLERELSRSRRTATPLGLIFFDIDKFKIFNDTYGHHGGDKALRELGLLLRSVLRKGLDFPCRFGGDEFVIISSSSSAASLLTVAERIQKEFRAQHDGSVTLSIGMSLLEPEDTAQSLLERCDKANYQAKAQGGNAIVHLQTNTPENEAN
jgi:diguanylate cyclase (GGDEF)-like protein